jgi:hypothetical protein
MLSGITSLNPMAIMNLPTLQQKHCVCVDIIVDTGV